MKRNIIYYIITILTALSLIGCAVNPNEISNTKTTGKTVTFSGAIDSGRAAGVDLSGLTWNVEAVKDTKTTAPDGTTEPETTDPISATMNGKSWTVSLPRDGGKWTIYAYGKLSSVPNNNIYYGSVDVTADAESKPNLSIPVCLGTNPGTINLTVKKDSDVTSVTKVEMRETREDLPFDTITATFNDNGIATLYKRPSAGSYPVTINFLDDDDNVLYQCRETIFVLSDCTTDTWLGNSSYIQNGEFTLTAAMIDRYGTEIVPNTGIVLYSKDDNGGIQYSYKNTESTEEPTNLTRATVDNASFCFDNEGGVYVLEATSDSNSEISYKGKDATTRLSISVSGVAFESIAYDRTQGNLYGKKGLNIYEINLPTNMASGGTFSIRKTYNITNTYQAKGSDMQTHNYPVTTTNCFAVNSGVVYVATYNWGVDDLLIINLNGSAGNTSEVVEVSDANPVIICDNLPDDFYGEPKITDILYQDGCVYMLLREYYMDSSSSMKYCSRGAVIKYDLVIKQFDIAGWTNTEDAEKYLSDDKYVYLYYKKNDVSDYLMTARYDGNKVLMKAKDITGLGEPYTDPDTEEEVQDDIPLLNLYAPNTTLERSTVSLNTKAFYGPQRFLAIRPKKLVIADDGVAFFTDELGAYCAKNVNRIVTVDLESFAVVNKEFEIGETTATFDKDKINMLCPEDLYDEEFYGGNVYEGNESHNQYAGSFFISDNEDIEFGNTDIFNYFNPYPIIPIK